MLIYIPLFIPLPPLSQITLEENSVEGSSDQESDVSGWSGRGGRSGGGVKGVEGVGMEWKE